MSVNGPAPNDANRRRMDAARGVRRQNRRNAAQNLDAQASGTVKKAKKAVRRKINQAIDFTERQVDKGVKFAGRGLSAARDAGLDAIDVVDAGITKVKKGADKVGNFFEGLGNTIGSIWDNS